MLYNYIPPYDGYVSKKLREAGGILVGKTGCDEFGMGATNENTPLVLFPTHLIPSLLQEDLLEEALPVLLKGVAFIVLEQILGDRLGFRPIFVAWLLFDLPMEEFLATDKLPMPQVWTSPLPLENLSMIWPVS